MRGRARRLTSERAGRLRVLLDGFLAQAPQAERVAHDPVRFPHRYRERADVEVAGLLAAALAYGRVDLFAPKVDALLGRMGPSPARFVQTLDAEGARALLQGFVYRFNVGTDLAVLLMGAGRMLREEGSLEVPFAQALEETGSVHAALSRWTARLRDVPLAPLARALGPPRGLDHLLPSPLGPGAAKRLNLYLRWMVRGPDAVDFGLWTRVDPARLIIPLDTHIGRISRRLGLTRRSDLSWKTAEEVTGCLRQVDAEDPVRFDFALCHYGMAGVCPPRARKEHCAACLLQPTCQVGRRWGGRAR